jgi:hypothetical protein
LLARICTILFLLLTPRAALAQTDLLIIPFVGAKFHGATTIFGGETVGQSKTTFGLSTAVLTDKFLGVEGDPRQTPQFFGPGVRQTVSGSVVTTLTGNVIIAVPKAITQESLRPYLVSGSASCARASPPRPDCSTAARICWRSISAAGPSASSLPRRGPLRAAPFQEPHERFPGGDHRRHAAELLAPDRRIGSTILT